MKQYMLKQLGPKDCGVAVTKMVLAIHYRNFGFLRLNIKEGLGDFSKIKDFAARYDLALQGAKVVDQEEFYKLKGLMIVQTKKDDIHHFILIRRVGKNYHVNDPSYGFYVMTKTELFEHFTGYYLEVISPRPKPYKLNAIDLIAVPIRKKTIISFVVFHLLSLISLFIAFMTMNDQTQIHLTILLSGFSFAFYLLSRQKFFRLSQHYDALSNAVIEQNSPKHFLEHFGQVQKLKSDFISPFINLFTSSITVVMILFVFTINDYRLIVSAALVFVLLLLSNLQEGKKYYQYYQLDHLVTNTSVVLTNRKENLAKISSQTHKLIQTNMFANILIDVVIFFLVVLVMLINQLASLNYLLLYFFMFMYLKSNLVTLLKWPQQVSGYYNTINQLEDIARKS